MQSLNGRKVLKVQLHEAAHAVNLGSVKTTVDSSLGGKVGGTELTLVEHGVLVKGQSREGKYEFILPTAACKMIQLVPDETNN